MLGYDAATDKFIIANPWGPKNNLLLEHYGQENDYKDQFSLSFEVDNTFIEIKDITPEYPVVGDSISFVAFSLTRS